MHHVVLERWSRGRSPLHGRDARVKIVALIAYLLALATTPPMTLAHLAGYALLPVCGVLLARLPPGGVLIRSLVILPFSGLFALLIWLSGDAARAIVLIEKSYLSALAALVIVGATPVPALLEGLRAMKVPRFLVLVVQFLYRYLFVIFEQAQHMRIAAVSRGGTGWPSGPGGRFAGAAGSVAVLFARSYERAEGIHHAMLSRGFEGRFPIATASELRAADVAFVTAVILLCAALRFAAGRTSL